MYLENTIRSIRDRLDKPPLSVDEVEDLELQLTLAESALEHYRQAYELELSVSGPEPPHSSGSASENGATRLEKRMSERRKDGLSLRARRSRNKRAAGWATCLPRIPGRDAYSSKAGD